MRPDPLHTARGVIGTCSLGVCGWWVARGRTLRGSREGSECMVRISGAFAWHPATVLSCASLAHQPIPSLLHPSILTPHTHPTTPQQYLISSPGPAGRNPAWPQTPIPTAPSLPRHPIPNPPAQLTPRLVRPLPSPTHPHTHTHPPTHILSHTPPVPAGHYTNCPLTRA